MKNEFAATGIQTKVHRLEALLTEAKLLSNDIEADVANLAKDLNVDHTVVMHAFAGLQKTQAAIGGAQGAVASAHRVLDAIRAKLGLKVTASGAWKDGITGQLQENEEAVA